MSEIHTGGDDHRNTAANDNDEDNNNNNGQLPDPKRRKLSSQSYLPTTGSDTSHNGQIGTTSLPASSSSSGSNHKQPSAMNDAMPIRLFQSNYQPQTKRGDDGWKILCVYSTAACIRHWQWTTDVLQRGQVLHKNDTDTQNQGSNTDSGQENRRRNNTNQGKYVVRDYQTGRTYPMKTPSLITNFMDTLGVRSDVGRVDALYTARPYIDPNDAASRTSCCIRLEVIAYVLYIQREIVHDMLVSGAANSFVKWFITYVQSGNIGVDCGHPLTQWQIDSAMGNNGHHHHHQEQSQQNNDPNRRLSSAGGPTNMASKISSRYRDMNNSIINTTTPTVTQQHSTATSGNLSPIQVDCVRRMRLRDEQLRMRTFFIQPTTIGRFVPLPSCDIAIDFHRNGIVPMSCAIHDIVCSPRIVLRPSASFLTGRAGVGKTRVALAMCRQTQTDSVRVTGDPVLMISQATLIFVRASVLDHWIQEARIVGFSDDEITVIASAVDWKDIGSATHLMRPGIVLVTHEFAFEDGHYYTTLLQMVSQQQQQHAERGTQHNSTGTSSVVNSINNHTRGVVEARFTNAMDLISRDETTTATTTTSSRVLPMMSDQTNANNAIDAPIQPPPSLANIVFLEQTILKTQSFRRPSHQINQFSFASYFWNRIIVDDAEIRGSADDYMRFSCGSLWMILTRDVDIVEDQLSVPPTELAESVFGLTHQLLGSHTGPNNNNNDMFSLHRSVWYSVFKAASVELLPPSSSSTMRLPQMNMTMMDNTEEHHHLNSLGIAGTLPSESTTSTWSHDAEVHVHWVDLHPVEASIIDKCIQLTDDDDYEAKDAELYHLMHAAFVPDIYQWWPRRGMCRWWANSMPQSPHHIATQSNIPVHSATNTITTMKMDLGVDSYSSKNNNIHHHHEDTNHECFHHNKTTNKYTANNDDDYNNNAEMSEDNMLSELSDYYGDDDSTNSESTDDDNDDNENDNESTHKAPSSSSVGRSVEYFQNVLRTLCQHHYQEEEGSTTTASALSSPSAFSLTCPVCIESPSNILMKCGHMLCMQCMQSHLTHTKANPPQCPMCKTAFKPKSLYHVLIPSNRNQGQQLSDDAVSISTPPSNLFTSSKLRATAQLIKSLIDLRGLGRCRIMVCCMWASGLRRLQKLLHKLQHQGYLPDNLGRIVILESDRNESLTAASKLQANGTGCHGQIIQDFVRRPMDSSTNESCVQILMVPRSYRHAEDVLLGVHIDPHVVTDVIFMHPPTGSLFEIPHHVTLQTCFQTGATYYNTNNDDDDGDYNNTPNMHSHLASSSPFGPFAPTHHHAETTKKNITEKHKMNIHYIVAQHSIERTCVEGLAANGSGYFGLPLIHHHASL